MMRLSYEKVELGRIRKWKERLEKSFVACIRENPEHPDAAEWRATLNALKEVDLHLGELERYLRKVDRLMEDFK